MNKKVEFAVKEYQCPGCSLGSGIECFKPNPWGGVGCGEHSAGTFAMGVGKLFLGLPKGFNRLGAYNEMKPYIFEKFEDCDWDRPFNIPIWKHLNEHGHTLVRGLSPRTNLPYLHIFLEDCMDKFDCHEVTNDDIKEMD